MPGRSGGPSQQGPHPAVPSPSGGLQGLDPGVGGGRAFGENGGRSRPHPRPDGPGEVRSGGEGGCEVHNPGYDFNDDALTLGSTLWARVVEKRLAKDAR